MKPTSRPSCSRRSRKKIAIKYSVVAKKAANNNKSDYSTTTAVPEAETISMPLFCPITS